MTNGKTRIYVDVISLYRTDVFNFEGFGLLGAWSKKNKNFMIAGGGSYENLWNSHFRDFSSKPGIGKGFEVLSRPLPLKINPFSFEVDPYLSIDKPFADIYHFFGDYFLKLFFILSIILSNSSPFITACAFLLPFFAASSSQSREELESFSTPPMP